jgi:hypothetical protein
MLGFYEGFEVRQAAHPEAAVLLDPGVDGAKRFGIQVVDAVAPFAMFSNQMGAPQEAQMLGDGRARDREGFCYLAGGLTATTQKIEDGAARGIGQGLEGGFGGSGRCICN